MSDRSSDDSKAHHQSSMDVRSRMYRRARARTLQELVSRSASPAVSETASEIRDDIEQSEYLESPVINALAASTPTKSTPSSDLSQKSTEHNSKSFEASHGQTGTFEEATFESYISVELPIQHEVVVVEGALSQECSNNEIQVLGTGNDDDVNATEGISDGLSNQSSFNINHQCGLSNRNRHSKR